MMREPVATWRAQIQQPWESYQQAAEQRKKRFRESRESAPQQRTVVLQSKVLPPVADGEDEGGRLAPFETLAEARALLSQYQAADVQQTKDPVFQTTMKHSREEWQKKLTKKADLLRVHDRIRGKWEAAMLRTQANTHARDRLMLLALDNSRLQMENAGRKKKLDAEKSRRKAERDKVSRTQGPCTVTLPIKCPEGVVPGQTLRVKVDPGSSHPSMQDKQFDVKVPEGVAPGQPFNVQFNIDK
jgi:hypothetical protein